MTARAKIYRSRRTLMGRLSSRAVAAVLGLAMLHAASAVAAPDYPDKPVRLIVGFPPGGSTDVLARMVANGLSQKLGRQFIVENKPGASGMIGANEVAKARPDGYTLLFSSSTLATYRALYPTTPFDASKDFEPVSLVATTPYLLVVHPSLPVHSVSELIAYAKAHPGEINYAASAPGGGQHLAWEMFKRMNGVDLLYVPYAGTGALTPDLLAGRLQAAIDNVAVLAQQVRARTLRPIAVTGPKRSALLPGVPTAIESGLPGFDVVGWFAVFAPANTSSQVTARLSQAIGEIMREPAMRKAFEDLGADPDVRGPEALREFLASETSRWGKLIQDAGIKLQ
ncbi:hypothetical protein CAL29_23980 [Bordetella genomosp. 10]|uniref:ABC transporter substrate-binding protein n=1 Tax=Bordetella genomosp. 10 TaxID=1416804 RepID=A0A261S1J0_9BORD|nr:tripartite tricarboxylate transporter substrate binding protein [Bordetella genomosp. 10]OZI31011.1 hypothetical protein CAL29_23980 [Bordetella genomosp. 10]